MTEGIRCTFRGSWCAEGLRTAWDSVWRICGTKGTICWDGLDDIRGEYVKKAEGFFYECEGFVPTEEPDPKEQARIAPLAGRDLPMHTEIALELQERASHHR